MNRKYIYGILGMVFLFALFTSQVLTKGAGNAPNLDRTDGYVSATDATTPDITEDNSNRELEELRIKEVEPDKFAFMSLSGDLIEIGEEKHSPPQPYLKLNKWGGEVSLKVDVPYGKNGEKSLAQNRLRWANHKYDVEFYPREPEEIEEKGYKFTINEQGGVEFDVILKEPPESNIFEFPIEIKGLKFYYQPELTQEEKDAGDFRPENVVGSYAVYHESKQGDYSKLGGKNYKTGKAFHIYRPKVKDAEGNETWGELNIDPEKGVLTITVDRGWLSNAVYPVRIDPVFGYTPKGESVSAIQPKRYCAFQHTMPENGRALSMTGFFEDYKWEHFATIYVCIYDDNNGYPGNRVDFSEPWEVGESYHDWKTLNLTENGALTQNSKYWLAFFTAEDYIKIWFDFGGTSCINAYQHDASPATTFPAGGSMSYPIIMSLYCTYTTVSVEEDGGSDADAGGDGAGEDDAGTTNDEAGADPGADAGPGDTADAGSGDTDGGTSGDADEEIAVSDGCMSCATAPAGLGQV